MAKLYQINKYDVGNGPGVRTSIWFSGCNKKCPGCHNPDLQDFEAGFRVDDLVLEEILHNLRDPNVDGRLSVLGGEPLSRINAVELNAMLYYLRHHIPHLNVWVWTGHDFEYLLNRDADTIEAIEKCDVIVDGPYIQEEADLLYQYAGSKNQRVIDVQNSLKWGYTTLVEQ